MEQLNLNLFTHCKDLSGLNLVLILGSFFIFLTVPLFLFVCLVDVWKASKSLVQNIKNKNNIAVCTSMSMSLMLCEMKGALEESLLREKLEFKTISKLKKIHLKNNHSIFCTTLIFRLTMLPI